MQQQHQFQTLLQGHQLDEDVKKALAIAFCVNTANKTIDKAIDNTIDEDVNEIVNENKENEKIINVKEFSNKFSEIDNFFSTLLQQNISVPIRDKKDEIDETGKSLEELFDKAYKDNKVVKKIINTKAHGLQKLLTALTKKSIVLLMRDLKTESEQFYMKNGMYIPENKPLQLFLLQQHHDSFIHGHSEYKAMY